MRPPKLKRRARSTWLLLALMTIVFVSLASCEPSQRSAQRGRPIIVLRSRRVEFLDPNKPYLSTIPAAAIDRAYLMELQRLETAVEAGRLVWAKP